MSQNHIENNSYYENVKWNALSDPTRRKIIEILSRSECIPSLLLKELKCSQPALSSHLRKLRDSRLVETKRNGQQIMYSLNVEQFASIDQFIGKIPLSEKNPKSGNNKEFFFNFENEKINKKLKFGIQSEEITCKICDKQTCKHIFEIISNSKIREEIARQEITIDSNFEKYIIQLHQRQQSLRESTESVIQNKTV